MGVSGGGKTTNMCFLRLHYEVTSTFELSMGKDRQWVKSSWNACVRTRPSNREEGVGINATGTGGFTNEEIVSREETRNKDSGRSEKSKSKW